MCRQLWSIRQLDSPKHRRGMSFPRVFSILSFYVERTQFGKVCHAGQEPWKRELERLRPRIHHESSWKNRWKIVYKMKPSLHLITLHNQYFAQPNVDELLVNLSSLFAIVLKLGIFCATPENGHVQRYSDFNTSKVRKHFPFIGKFRILNQNPHQKKFPHSRARVVGPEVGDEDIWKRRWRSWASFSHQLWMEKPIEALLVNGFHPKLRHWHGVKFEEDTGIARAWALSKIFVYFAKNDQVFSKTTRLFWRSRMSSAIWSFTPWPDCQRVKSEIYIENLWMPEGHMNHLLKVTPKNSHPSDMDRK